MIPFDSQGNQVSYPGSGCTLVENFVFEDILEYESFARGQSAVHIYFKRLSTGKRVSVFMTDLHDMMSHIDHGKIKGRFTFQKRGMNYGCKLIPY
jgi:hypothetical protein